jgi:hypothetical protein
MWICNFYKKKSLSLFYSLSIFQLVRFIAYLLGFILAVVEEEGRIVQKQKLASFEGS